MAGLLGVAPVVVGHERAAREQDLAGGPLARRDHQPVPALRHVVARGGDAAVAVAEVDARQVGADGQRGLARERAQHVLELERHAERPRGVHQRAVVGGARRPAVLGLQARQPRGRDLGQRLGVRDLSRVEYARAMRDDDRHAPHLAAVCDGDEQRRLDAVVVHQRGADDVAAAGVRHVQRRAGGHGVRDAGRAVQRQTVIGQRGVVDRGLAAAAVLRDLDQVQLVGAQLGPQGVGQRRAELGGGTGLGRGARETGERAVGGFEYGVTFPGWKV